MRRLLHLAALGGALLVPSVVVAEGAPVPMPSRAPSPSAVQRGVAEAPPVLLHPLTIGVGAVGYAGGSFLDQPDDHEGYVYPGFGGFGGGGGFSLDVRAFEIVGLEFNALRTGDYGKGEVEFPGVTIDVEVGQSAWHFPVFLKLVYPGELVRPSLMVGMEFVKPDKQETTVTPDVAELLTVDSEDYSLLAFGLGLEVVLPIEGVDLRIPISFRGAINLDTADRTEERFVMEGSRVGFRSEWQYHAGVTLGLAYYLPVLSAPVVSGGSSDSRSTVESP